MELSEDDWDFLLDKIKDKKCTPFIGPEICALHFLTDKDIAQKWVKEYNYPLDEPSQLSRLAQFLKIQDKRPAYLIKKEIQSQNMSFFDSADYKDSPYDVLARLNLPIYITTNYDGFMEYALAKRGKEPKSEYCAWNTGLINNVKNVESPITYNKTYKPSVACPLVYHLYGTVTDTNSIVLTELDYVDFLICLAKESDQVLPSVIRIALADNTYLFVGYRLEDTSFLAMFRIITTVVNKLVQQGAEGSIAVQFTSILNPDKEKMIQDYLNRYTNDLFRIRAHLGDVDQFLKKLSRRMWG